MNFKQNLLAFALLSVISTEPIMAGGNMREQTLAESAERTAHLLKIAWKRRYESALLRFYNVYTAYKEGKFSPADKEEMRVKVWNTQRETDFNRQQHQYWIKKHQQTVQKLEEWRLSEIS